MVIGSAMQDNRAEEMLAAIHRAGVDIRPEAMGITWDEVAQTLYRLASFVKEAGLWYTVADEKTIDEGFVQHLWRRIEDTFAVTA